MARSMLKATIVALLAVGCTGKDPTRPGDSIGVFHVTGKLVSTSCGQTPDPWAFDVRLRHDKSTLYWVQGDAPVSGLLDSAEHAVLKASQTQTVRAADEKMMTAACALSRTDTVDLVLAMPGADIRGATSFKGTLAYQFKVVDGSSCDDQLKESGGDYATLPCTVSYELAGTRTGDAK
jgi:hypothetical protein